jgi:hypothetical protein
MNRTRRVLELRYSDVREENQSIRIYDTVAPEKL